MEHKFQLENKKIWIAGETGMVGRALTRRLEQENCEILSAPHQELDLTNQAETLDWLQDNKPDVAVICAAKVGGIGANNAYPADFIYQNLAIAQNTIHGAYLAGVDKLLYLGSSCIYPKQAPQPIKEEYLLTDMLEPTNEPYAIAKIAGLKLCEFYRKQYGYDFISAMPTNLYGEGDTFDPEDSHVIPAMILKFHQAKMNDDKDVILWGSGKPMREFLYVDDLADGLVHIIKNYSDAQTINIGSGSEISIHDLAMLIKDIVGFEGDVVFDTEKPDGTMRKLLDCRKLNNVGWNANTPLKQGIKRSYQWFLSNHTELNKICA